MSQRIYPDLDDFSLIRNGLFHNLLSKIRLGESTRKNIRLRILVVILVTWVPIFVLASLQGLAFDGVVDVPFLKDIATHVRLLLIIPLMIVAELAVDFRLKEQTIQFFRAGILDETDLDRYETVKDSIVKLANSKLADVVVILVIIINLVSRVMLAEVGDVSSWMFLPNSQGGGISWAAYYSLTVSIVIFQYIIFRWIWRWVLWVIYFRKLSRLPLKLNSAHPDLAGGIGFLGFPPGPFISVLVALSILFTSIIAERVYFFHFKLPSFYPAMIGFAVFSILFNVLPLLPFMKPLIAQRRKGVFEYSALIQKHHREFDDKWLHSENSQVMSGFSDASSLTDLNTAFDVVKNMGVFPFNIKTMMSSILIAILPMLPLFVFEFSVDELLLKVIKILI